MTVFSLARVLLIVVLIVIMLTGQSLASTRIWIAMGPLSSHPFPGSTFTTDLRISSWNGTVGALDLIIRYDPTVLHIVDVLTPPDSPFYPDCFADQNSYTSGETRIACFQVTDWEAWETPMSFGTLTWEVVGAANSVTDIIVESIRVVDARWSRVEVMVSEVLTVKALEQTEVELAIQAAIEAIAAIPMGGSLDLNYITLVEEARSKVDDALTAGAMAEDITNLNDLEEAEVIKGLFVFYTGVYPSTVWDIPALKYMEDSKQAAIQEAIGAIAALPAVDDLSLNDQAGVEAARGKVADALVHAHIFAEEITNLDHLEAAEAKIAELAVAADTQWLEVGYAAGDSREHVTQDLTLPTAGPNETSISWASNNADIVSAGGSVNRPSYDKGDTTVTLTATITKGDASDTKIFAVMVKASVPLGDINHDGETDLVDAILAMQILSGISPAQPVYREADVSGDGRIGIEEVLFIMQKVANLH